MPLLFGPLHRWQAAAVRHGAYLLVIAVPALLWLAPMLQDPRHTVVGWEGDNLYYVRQFWWVKYALVNLRHSLFFNPLPYFPFGYDVSRGELSPANTLIALPATLLAGPVFAYNLSLLGSFVLTGWGTYAWVYRLTGSRAGALTAAVIAEMAPYRLAHAEGHLPLVSTEGLPLALWTFEEFLRTKSRAWAAALAICLAAAALSSWYYAYSIVIVFPIYAGVRTWRSRRSGESPWTSRPFRAGVLIALFLGALLVVPFAFPYVESARAGGLRRSFYEMNGWSLNFYDFFIPNAGHPFWAAPMRFAFPVEADQWTERAVSLGYVALVLAGHGVFRAFRRNGGAAVPALLVVWVTTALIALGPMLHSGDRPVLLPMPYIVTKMVDWLFARVRPFSPLREHLWKNQVTPVPLPSLFLYLLVPGTAGMRVMARFGYWTVLMTAAMAGFGMRELRRGRRHSRLVRGAILSMAICGIVFESWSQKILSRWEPRAVDRWIAAQPSNEVIVELPLRQSIRPAQDYYATVQQHPTILGPIGDSFKPAVFATRLQTLNDFPAPATIAALREWGATLLIIHTDGIANWPLWEAQLTNSRQLALVSQSDPLRVYRLH